MHVALIVFASRTTRHVQPEPLPGRRAPVHWPAVGVEYQIPPSFFSTAHAER
jgi:hypothetical protein